MRKRFFAYILTCICFSCLCLCKIEANNIGDGNRDEKQHDYVDLGLPSDTLWATCNIGAKKPQDRGLYFAWGETYGYKGEEHVFYKNYKWHDDIGCGTYVHGFNKYTREDNDKLGGWYKNDTYIGTTVEGVEYKDLTELLPEDDAATICWGNDWCMPTESQIAELIDTANTSLRVTRHKGIKGLKVKSKRNNNSIFLPTSGNRTFMLYNAKKRGYYWSKSLSKSSICANSLAFKPDSVFIDEGIRSDGFVIRPVKVLKNTK